MCHTITRGYTPRPRGHRYSPFTGPTSAHCSAAICLSATSDSSTVKYGWVFRSDMSFREDYTGGRGHALQTYNTILTTPTGKAYQSC